MEDTDAMSDMIIDRLGSVGCKTALRVVERAVGTVERSPATVPDRKEAQLSALENVLDDMVGDDVLAMETCTVR